MSVGWKVHKPSKIPDNLSLPGSLSAAAAPGIFVLDFSIWTVAVQPIGLVDYVSLKKSIWRVRLFSRWFLKQFIDDASTSSWERLFHQFITRWEKKYNRVSQQQFLFTSFQLCPLVTVPSALWKKRDQGVDDNPFAILKTSIDQPCFLLSSRVHSPKCLNLGSYGRLLRWGNNRVKRC